MEGEMRKRWGGIRWRWELRKRCELRKRWGGGDKMEGELRKRWKGER